MAQKKIVVFADGTGNAFTTQESNVWRLYQALDQTAPDQIARYIPGVGTSGFRPFALLDGATGIGVPSNVRKLYRFLCWNWNDGDEIYMFGFSRGAFTIRTLIALIDSQGLVPREIDGERVSHAEMERNAMAAWRAVPQGQLGIRLADDLADPSGTRPAAGDLPQRHAPSLLRRCAHKYRPATERRAHPLRRPVRHGGGVWRADRGIAPRHRRHALANLVQQPQAFVAGRYRAARPGAGRRTDVVPSAALRHERGREGPEPARLFPHQGGLVRRRAFGHRRRLSGQCSGQCAAGLDGGRGGRWVDTACASRKTR